MVHIVYDPPVAVISEEWRNIFIESEREKLDANKREEYEKLAIEALNVQFLKNSQENDQKFFASNLTDFSESGLKIYLNFSNPLFVSQGEVSPLFCR